MNSQPRTAATGWVKYGCFFLLFFFCFSGMQAQELKKIPPKRDKNEKPSEETLDERRKAIENDRSIDVNSVKKDLTIDENAPALSDPLSAECFDRVTGVKQGYAILYTKFMPSDRQSFKNIKEECTCILQQNLDLKGCIDMDGKKLMKVKKGGADSDKFYLANIASTPTMKANDPRIANSPSRQAMVAEQSLQIRVVSPTGKSNCRLFSENDKYIISLEDKEPQNSVLPEKEITISSDGDLAEARWDFIPVDEEDKKAGFYMVTQEATPRAVMRNGEQLSLHDFETMDGKAKENSKWQYFISGLDKDGHTRYVIHPADDVKHAIALDERTGTLSLKQHGVKEDLSASNNEEAGLKFGQFFWNLESIF